MARRIPQSLLALILLFAIAMVVGCESNGSDLVATLPPPNFDGPVITAPLAQRPAPKPWVAPVPEPAVKPGLPGEGGWIPVASARAWKWIVVHHSATPAGSAAVFDKMHRDKGWDELGYHFVIGNGTDSGDGVIEVGPRWTKQKWGAHAKTPDNRFNDFGIGICLVGNFDMERPTPQQMESLAKLTAYLMRTYRVPAGNVIGHRDTKATECPGKNVNLAQVRRLANQALADAGETPVDESVRTAGAVELLETDESAGQ